MGFWLVVVAVIGALIIALHWISYTLLKTRIGRSQRWGLNVCCGTVDGGGVNADIVKHGDPPNFVALDSVYDLPFSDGQFDSVLCSHTAEHVADPDRLDRELRRVAKQVTYVLPPLWDLAAVLNVLEHRWVFLCVRKTHARLPRRVRLPMARTIQARFGQRITA